MTKKHVCVLSFVAAFLGLLLALWGCGDISTRSALKAAEANTQSIITTVAGNGTQGYNGEGAATSAELNNPHGVALDSSGNLYIADFENNRIRMVH